MTGPKLNEGATVAGERVGTRATAKYVRSSASKAREVLDLVRGLPVRHAAEVLQFSERGISRDVAKVLNSAVANAVNNDGQDVDELFVIACFADEGPTLRRFRPRARGRATRIRKRTCHITVIVARMSDERIEVLQNRDANRGGGAARSSSEARRRRVERSRQRAAALKTGEGDESTDATDDVTDEAGDTMADESDVIETDVVDEVETADAEDADDASDETVEAVEADAADEADADVDTEVDAAADAEVEAEAVDAADDSSDTVATADDADAGTDETDAGQGEDK